MSWIMIAVVAGSIVVSGHDTREACEGRAAMVREATKGAAKCVEAPSGTLTFNSSSMVIPQQWICTNSVCSPR